MIILIQVITLSIIHFRHSEIIDQYISQQKQTINIEWSTLSWNETSMVHKMQPCRKQTTDFFEMTELNLLQLKVLLKKN